MSNTEKNNNVDLNNQINQNQEQPQNQSQDNKSNSKYTLSNGKTGFQTIHDGLQNISDKGKIPTLKYFQNEGKISYFLYNGNSNKAKQLKQTSTKILSGLSPQDKEQAQKISNNRSMNDSNLLGQSANKMLYEHQQNTLDNGMTASQYLKKTLAPLSDDGKLVMSKFYRDESRASYYAHKGNDLKKESYFNNAQHQLNNLNFDDTQKIPTKELTDKLSDKDWQKVGRRANKYVQHRENGWKQAQFLYQAMGRESYFSNRNNDKRAKAYHEQATKEYNAMTPDTQKRAMHTYDANNVADLSKKANRWINRHFGRQNRNSNYRYGNRRDYQYRQHRSNYNYSSRRSNPYQNRTRQRSNNYTQSHVLNSVMGNHKAQNYRHTSHYDVDQSSPKMSVTQHEKKQPQRNSRIDKRVSFSRKNGGITPSDMPF